MSIEEPIGVVLAGGRGRRLGAISKPEVDLAGLPLWRRAHDALAGALADVVLVAKSPLSGAETWVEPPAPTHPLAGIAHALQRAAGRAVFVCAADLALIDAVEVNALLALRSPASYRAVAARAGGRLQPLFAIYEPESLPSVLDARSRQGSMMRLVVDLGSLVVERPDAERYVNVNTPQELARVRDLLISRT